MPMPTLLARYQRTTVQARAFHENIKRAATAPTWNRDMKTTVIQLSLPPWALRPSWGMAGVRGEIGRAEEAGETTGTSNKSVAIGDIASGRKELTHVKQRRRFHATSPHRPLDVTLL